MENVAHIKINQPGVKLMAPYIRVTKTTKEIDQADFSLFNENIFDSKNESIDFKLPFVSDLSLNYNKGLVSFVLVNERYRYYSTVRKDTVYLIPWGVFYEDVAKDLPVIKLGSVTEWSKKLDMQERMIAYFLIKNKAGKYVLADFKTSSKNTISEYERYIKSLECLRVNERYEVESSMFIKGRIEGDMNVHYLSFSDIVSDLRNIEEPAKKVSAAMIERYEKKYVEDEKNKFSNAIDLENANEFFGKKVVIKLDRDQNNSFEYNIDSVPLNSGNNSTQNNADDSVTSEYIKMLIDKEIPLKIAEALVNKHGDKAYELAEQAKFSTKNLLKLF